MKYCKKCNIYTNFDICPQCGGSLLNLDANPQNPQNSQATQVIPTAMRPEEPRYREENSSFNTANGNNIGNSNIQASNRIIPEKRLNISSIFSDAKACVNRLFSVFAFILSFTALSVILVTFGKFNGLAVFTTIDLLIFNLIFSITATRREKRNSFRIWSWIFFALGVVALALLLVEHFGLLSLSPVKDFINSIISKF